MSQVIHRKQTTQRLKDKAISGNVSEQDLHDALAVIEAQNDLLLKMSENLRNSRKGNKETNRAITRFLSDKQYWINRTQIAERRLELVRKELWGVEDLLRNLGIRLRTESILDMSRRHKEEEKREKLFNDELDRKILEQLDKEKQNESGN